MLHYLINRIFFSLHQKAPHCTYTDDLVWRASNLQKKPIYLFQRFSIDRYIANKGKQKMATLKKTESS